MKNINLPENIQKEELSIIYLNALAAFNGFSLDIVRRDYWSIDVIIRSEAGILLGSIDKTIVDLKVQLKATTQLEKKNGYVKFKNVPKRNIDHLKENYDMIIAILDLPENKNEWLICEPNGLTIRNCMYWESLYQKETKELVLDIDKNNLLTADTLKEIMTKLAEIRISLKPDVRIL